MLLLHMPAELGQAPADQPTFRTDILINCDHGNYYSTSNFHSLHIYDIYLKGVRIGEKFFAEEVTVHTCRWVDLRAEEGSTGGGMVRKLSGMSRIAAVVTIDCPGARDGMLVLLPPLASGCGCCLEHTLPCQVAQGLFSPRQPLAFHRRADLLHGGNHKLCLVCIWHREQHVLAA